MKNKFDSIDMKIYTIQKNYKDDALIKYNYFNIFSLKICISKNINVP